MHANVNKVQQKQWLLNICKNVLYEIIKGLLMIQLLKNTFLLLRSKSDETLHALSGLYAQIIIVVAAILVFTELLHGPVSLFFFHVSILTDFEMFCLFFFIYYFLHWK